MKSYLTVVCTEKFPINLSRPPGRDKTMCQYPKKKFFFILFYFSFITVICVVPNRRNKPLHIQSVRICLYFYSKNSSFPISAGKTSYLSRTAETGSGRERYNYLSFKECSFPSLLLSINICQPGV